jgi:hypothetical protein
MTRPPCSYDDGGTPPPALHTPAPTRTRTPAHNPKSKDLPPLLQHSQTSQPSTSRTKITLHSAHLQLPLHLRRSESLPL